MFTNEEKDRLKKMEKYFEINNIFKRFGEELSNYQRSLTDEDVKSGEYNDVMEGNIMFLLRAFVGEEALQHFLIGILYKLSCVNAKKNLLHQQQIDRVERIRKKEKKMIECKSCGYLSENKTDFDEEGLCRNCEAGKLDAQRGHK